MFNPWLQPMYWLYMKSIHFILTQITMRRFKYTLVRLSPIWISTLIFPQCSERISIAKTIHEMHINILRIYKSRHFCCWYCSCYRYYCPSLLTALQLSVLSRTHTAEPTTNDHNNTKRHQRKNVVTRKRWRIWKKLVTFSAPNSLPNLLCIVLELWITLYTISGQQ
jgi:hypothetical protein